MTDILRMTPRHGLLIPVLALCGLVAAVAPAGAEVSAPRIDAVQLAQPLPLPYDDKADAAAEVNAALARAAQSGKRVLIDLGGNWCGDCRVFAAMLQLPEVHRFVDSHFELVLVNVGRFTTNLEVPARFGVPGLKAAPTILIVSPQGQLLNGDDIVALQDARAMTPQAVVDWLAHWAAPVSAPDQG
jgi:thiol-disulfide isomerase/thioredoxin